MDPAKISDLEEFYKQFKVRKYKRGELLIRSDDDPHGIFCLTKGYVRQFSISPTGYELTYHILKPIAYFPMAWAINDVQNIYDFEALTLVEAGRAPRNQVIKFIKDNPKVMFEVMRELIKKYAETMSRYRHLVFDDAYHRVISILLYIARHFGENEGEGVMVRYWFKQQDIATLVGIARETAGTELVILEKKGLIKHVNHSLLIESVKKLEQELDIIPRV
jgi:CRP-like cAMP-binding protein